MEIAPNPSPPPWKDEGFQGFECLLAIVNNFFDPFDLFSSDGDDSFVAGIRWRRQFAAEVEKLFLDIAQDLIQKTMCLPLLESLLVEDPCQTDDGIEFVHGPVGLDPRGVLGNPLPTNQTRFPFVTRTGINAIDSYGHGICQNSGVKFQNENLFLPNVTSWILIAS